MYIVVRSDLVPGLQAAQVGHAAFEFTIQFPAVVERWNKDSNFIAVLACQDEQALTDLHVRAAQAGAEHLLIHDADLGDDGEYTAIVIEPGYSYLTAQLPCALKETAVT